MSSLVALTGKSSLVTAILRLVELDGGVVEIDGVNVATIGLRTLRSAVAIIPQVLAPFCCTVYGRFMDV